MVSISSVLPLGFLLQHLSFGSRVIRRQFQEFTDQQILDNTTWADIQIFENLDLLKARKTQQSLNSGSELFFRSKDLHPKEGFFRRFWVEPPDWKHVSVTPYKQLRRTFWLLIGLIANHSSRWWAQMWPVSLICVFLRFCAVSFEFLLSSKKKVCNAATDDGRQQWEKPKLWAERRTESWSVP